LVFTTGGQSSGVARVPPIGGKVGLLGTGNVVLLVVGFSSSHCFIIMPVFRVAHCLEGSQRFLEDSVTKAEGELSVRSSDIHASEIGGDLHVIVLSHTTSNMQCRTAKSTVTMHKLVVMDGSHGVFKVQLNTSLSRSTRAWAVTPGCTLSVKRWNWIWCDHSADIDCVTIRRGVLLIHNYSWKPAPPTGPLMLRDGAGAPVVVASDETRTKIIDVAVIDYIEEHGCIGWMVHIINENDEQVQVLMSDDDLRDGCFVQHVEAKKKFLAGVTSDKKCQCFDHHYTSSDDEDDDSKEPTNCKCKSCCGVGFCVTLQFPIEKIHVDRQIVFEDAIQRIDEASRLADAFDELPPSKKRWCVCWWCSVNLFQVRGFGNRKKLPDCFVDVICQQHPNDKGEFFTGYKRDEDFYSQEEGSSPRGLVEPNLMS